MPQIHKEARTEVLRQLDAELYAKSRLRLHKEQVSIIIDNSTLCGNRDRCMRFRGEFYSYGMKDAKPPKPVNLLHRDLRAGFKGYLAKVDALQTERSLAMGYAITALTNITHQDELYTLFPDSLHSILRKVDGFFFQGAGSMCPEAIQAFMASNQKYIRLLKARLAYNLLDAATV